MPNHADWQRPDGLTPQEEQVLALVRQGKVDAEIAVRLGISNAEVKQSVDRIAQRFGLPDGSGLRAPPQLAEESAAVAADSSVAVVRRFSARTVALAAAVGLLVGLALTWLAMRESQHDAVSPTLDAETSPPTPTFVLREGRTVIDAGPLFSVLGAGRDVFTVQTRGEVSLLRLAGDGLMEFETGIVRWDRRTPNHYPLIETFFGRVGDRAILLHLAPADDATGFVVGSADSMAIFTKDDSDLPLLLLWADGIRSEVGADGHLYLDAEPLSQEAVVAFDTGEILDVSGAQRLGRMGGSWSLCADESSGACYVVSRPDPRGGLTEAPARGTLVCRPDGVLELASDGLRLEFQRISPSSSARLGCDPISSVPRPTNVGDMLSPSWHYEIRAFTSGGQQVPVVAARDGTLYVGDIPLKFGCPCRSGS